MTGFQSIKTNVCQSSGRSANVAADYGRNMTE